MKKPIVSVILPVRNGEKYIRRSIESVINQTFKRYELIIVDDGSTDSTGEIIDEYRDKAIIIHQNAQGASKAINSGLEIYNGDYFCFIAHDDWWVPEKLEVELSYFEPGIGVVYSDYYEAYTDSMKLIKLPELDPNMILVSCLVPSLTGATIRKECMEKIRESKGYYFDEKLRSSMDWDLWIRLSRVCKFKHVSIPLSYYRRHPSQTVITKAHIEDTWKVCWKYNGASPSKFVDYYLVPLINYYLRPIAANRGYQLVSMMYERRGRNKIRHRVDYV